MSGARIVVLELQRIVEENMSQKDRCLGQPNTFSYGNLF